MTAPRKPELEARAVLRRFNVEAPPIDVEDIAAQMGLSVVRQPFDGNLSGMLQRLADGAVIGVNSLHAGVRQRFTIAHELGHFVLHRRDTFIDEVWVDYRDDRSSAGTHRQEIQANAFAAELLMPEDVVREAVGRLLDRGVGLLDAGLLVKLASEFDVSVEAMSHRLANLAISLQI